MPNFFENEKNQQKNALNFPFFWKCRKMYGATLDINKVFIESINPIFSVGSVMI